MDETRQLATLEAGQLIPFGGDRMVAVPADLAAAFTRGDRLVVVQDTGALLHIPAVEFAKVGAAVGRAQAAFAALAGVGDDAISEFYDTFARRLGDDAIFAPIAAANAADVATAAASGRSTTRLVLSDRMRADMIAGLRVWRDLDVGRDAVSESVEHEGWTVTARHAPLGVVGFVFGGRPNVFADATGVLRTGNTAVLRIGSDALGTARAIVEHALQPALRASGLPDGSVMLVDSPARAAGWALFNDRRLALAIARGSGEAVAQLGAVARQAGVPVSLHGTGGGWMVAAASADAESFGLAVEHSLDRKVCNTLNVCCVVAARAADLVPTFLSAIEAAGAARGTTCRLHVVENSAHHLPPELVARDEAVVQREADLGTEWEWEDQPEVTLVVVESVGQAIELFNRYSPRLVASLVSEDVAEHAQFYAACDAPFVGNGFTRWVDGQFALDRPELGLSNWANGRLLARSAVLSGDSVFTVRLTATVTDPTLHR
ncbi:MAG TPA: aldehyde dehydrogenase family protein [Ilumatobacteraceae bacterium]